MRIMNRFNILFTLLLLFFSFPVLCQLSPKKVKRLERDGEITMRYEEYPVALEIYHTLLENNPNNPSYLYNIGVCHLNLSQKSEALNYFQQTASQDPNYQDLNLRLGQTHHLLSDFDVAIEHYQKALKDLENEEQDIKANTEPKYLDEDMAFVSSRKLALEQFIEECKNGNTYTNRPLLASIRNLGSVINSIYPDYVPLISEDTTTLVFTSRRPSTTGGKISLTDNLYFEDIYQSQHSGAGWGNPQRLQINRKYHDAGAALSADGQTLYLYRDRKKGDLFVSKYNSNSKTWSKPQKLGKEINTKFQETSLSLSEDGNTMYFASSREGGFGGLDIYRTKKQGDGSWGTPENLGPKINTPYDDDAPFLSFDGQYLYFSSRGHASMGGFDIYRSQKVSDTEWSEPISLGYPINGPDDDLHLVLTPDNRTGYYVSNDAAGLGMEDIYVISAPRMELPPLDMSGLTLIASGGGQDTTDNHNNTGQIPDPDFDFEVTFLFDRSDVQAEKQPYVQSLLAYLKQYPSTEVEIIGHTCNIGPASYNLSLSERRAQSVADYLISEGIAPQRIKVRGKGEEEPLFPNDTPANRAKNRRTEYKIIKKILSLMGY